MSKFLNADFVACLSPHPDDCEYAISATVSKNVDTIFHVYNISSGGKRRKSRKYRNGGSPLSYMVNKIYKQNTSCKSGSSKFPKSNNNNLMKLSPPIYRNGILLGGGSDWKSTLYSVKSPLSKRAQKLGKRFTKKEIYKQIENKIHKGKMFKPF